MDEVRSAAAQAGHVDPWLLVHGACTAFRRAKTQDELDTVYKTYVRPVHDQLDPIALSIIQMIHDANLAILQLGGRR